MGGKKLKKIGKVSPYLFGDHLVIALSKDWINVTNSVPEFLVIIDDSDRLVLIGPTIMNQRLRGDSS